MNLKDMMDLGLMVWIEEMIFKGDYYQQIINQFLNLMNGSMILIEFTNAVMEIELFLLVIWNYWKRN